MSHKKNLIVLTAIIFTGFLGASAANAQNLNQQCYTLASLQGYYAAIGNYGDNVASALAARYLDGNGNLTGTGVVNGPTAGSTTGARTLTTTINTGTYTVNCDGTGTFNRVITNVTTGAVSTAVNDFIITGAIVQAGQLLATAIVDAQRTPSTIVPGGVFVTFVHTRLPDAPI
jgi:hypothetical protein